MGFNLNKLSRLDDHAKTPTHVVKEKASVGAVLRAAAEPAENTEELSWTRGLMLQHAQKAKQINTVYHVLNAGHSMTR